MPTLTQPLCYNCFAQHDSHSGPCPHCGFDLRENEEKYPLALRAGTVLNGRYIVGRVLGQGGFGITYLALDTQLNARVAVKEFMPSEIATRVYGTTVSVMSGDKTQDFSYGAERFQEEARTLAKFIGHPNIAGVSSYFDENDTSYFVMDYIEGVSFKSYIANAGGTVSVDEALNVMIPVLRALSAVHQEGFVHRDVTPDNIYISKDGNVKLLDFGSARYSIGDKSKSLDVILKVGYAPKEQYIRRGRQGPFTDVYSCAACFYAAITGYLPPESLERLDQDTLTPISQMGVDIPPWLDYAVLKGLAVQPEDRFQTAEEFLAAIEGQTMTAPPVTAAEAAAQAARVPAKKKTGLIVGIAAACLAVAVGVGVMLGVGNGGESGGSVVSDSGGGSTVAGIPLKKAEVPSITIAGQEYSTDLRELRLEGMGLTDADIEPLKYMINLTYLDLRENNITDLSPIAGLTGLQSLILRKNDIQSLAPLSGLVELTRLDINGGSGVAGNSAIHDLSPLAGLTNLRSLALPPGCAVSDLSPLSGLTGLTELQMEGWDNLGVINISDLTPLASLTKLETLSLTVQDLVSLEPLAGLTELRSLRLYGRFGDCSLSPLAGLTKLETIELYSSSEFGVCGMKTADLSAFSDMTNLKQLNLVLAEYNSGGARAENLDGLAGLTGLQSLRLRLNGIDHFRWMRNMDQLREAEIDGSDATYTTLEGMEGLTSLQSLTLPMRTSPPQAYDISALASCTQLQSLQLDRTIADLAPLSGLTNLRSLNISNGYSCGGPVFRSLEPLRGLDQVADLRLILEEATDLSPLSGMTALNTVWIQLGGQTVSVAPLAQLPALQSLTISNSRYARETDSLSHIPNLSLQ